MRQILLFQKSAISFLILLLMSLMLVLSGCRATFVPPPGEVEATEYMGTKLTPINEQGNNALAGTQHIEQNTYLLTVDGLVDRPLMLSYSDLQKYPAESKLIYLMCVEGWGFTAKWTGPRLIDILNDAGLKQEAKTVVFHTADVTNGYSSLDLSFIRDKNIILAIKLNDVTLPEERGFPFQVVAEGKYGYKWSKWVTRIRVIDTDFHGYWESAGYSNIGDIR